MYGKAGPTFLENIMDTIIIFLKDSTGLSGVFLLYWLLNISINLLFTIFIKRKWLFILYTILYIPLSLLGTPYPSLIGFENEFIPNYFSPEKQLHYTLLSFSFLALLINLNNLFNRNHKISKKILYTCTLLPFLIISFRYWYQYSFQNGLFGSYLLIFSIMVNLMLTFFMTYKFLILRVKFRLK